MFIWLGNVNSEMELTNRFRRGVVLGGIHGKGGWIRVGSSCTFLLGCIHHPNQFFCLGHSGDVGSGEDFLGLQIIFGRV